MDRSQLVTVCFVGLAILAILGASQVLLEPGEPAAPGADGDGIWQPTVNETVQETTTGDPPAYIEGLVLLLVALVVAVLYGFLDDFQASFRLVLILLVLLAVLFSVVYLLDVFGVDGFVEELPGVEEPVADDSSNAFGLEDDDASDAVAPAAEHVTIPRSALMLIGVVAVLLLGAVASLLAPSRDRPVSADEHGTHETTGDDVVEALGIAAGTAADRIEHHDAWENQIYRAWFEMTGLLDVDAPETKTPGDFADAAIEAGLRAEDVEALTSLFEAVRYGGYEPTTEREARAIETFRTIERRYAPEDDRA